MPIASGLDIKLPKNIYSQGDKGDICVFGTPKLLFSGLHLGEGPVWLAAQNTLAFLDIIKKRIYLLPEHATCPRVVQLREAVGCVTPMSNGHLLAAVRDILLELDCETGQRTPLLCLNQPRWLRFNDGKCDHKGRLWVGTMAKNQNHSKAKGGGSLFCIERGVSVFSQGGYSIPNGLVFRSDGNFYHTDTATGDIDLCTYSADGTTLGRRRVVHFSQRDGAPDGFCADVEGNLWVALWGSGKIICIKPQTGERLHTLTLPDQLVSCCCFGGSDLSTLYVTTAQDKDGLGGHLFAIPTQTRGALPFPYRKD